VVQPCCAALALLALDMNVMDSERAGLSGLYATSDRCVAPALLAERWGWPGEYATLQPSHFMPVMDGAYLDPGIT
jgi:hypothetical protein